MKCTKYLGFCLMVMLLLAGCSSNGNNTNQAESSETTLDKAKRQGFITVGFANEMPYAYATPDGKLTGASVEVARKVLTNLGIEQMDGVLTEFGSLIPGLQAQRFDLITAGMFITKERAEQVDFANPEYSIGEAIAVKKGNPLNIHSYEDIKNNPDVKVAVMVGVIEVNYLKSVGVQESQIVTVPDQPSAISALQSGRADVITMTGPSLQAVLDSAKDSEIERVMDFEQPIVDGNSVRGYGAAVFRQEDDEFREAFNQELQKLQESGELLDILMSFGFTEQELPGDMTTEELLN
ncbi:ectoine/hydroxyectoine ABC transporter substrate-binding protein EhuB [Paenibacillus montaniterrae]|uniref:Ectoine/hydroxyectoine ABC transporter substrate-binding protein EhuB n=1 Tax=Paenibacillus montaniterrae TaxID=429341 RepID=A0A919YRQ4_9BACL|nr:ectoine/hydroxyectoine ABC transporter substrate-binding protein EhuB [Paenibacillus montaniterrae]GIP17146.1 ectoine/hydroxyectoine ABC transporter substrate-binding protein EhuB [Paenibacillus montaniterrae]